MAVVAAVLATALLSGLGLALALMGMGEASLASNDRTARSLREASEGAIQLAAADLRVQPAWDAVLAAGAQPVLSSAPGRFLDGSLLPPAPWGSGPINLAAASVRVQGASDAGRQPGDAPQTWRLFLSGPLERAIPGASAGPWYIAVWVADDPADSDGDGARDSNGIIAVRGLAFGPAGAVGETDDPYGERQGEPSGC